jgi:hypothetical protein
MLSAERCRHVERHVERTDEALACPEDDELRAESKDGQERGWTPFFLLAPSFFISREWLLH